MKIGRGVSELWRVENRPLPLTWPMAYTTACTTVQAVIIITQRRSNSWASVKSTGSSIRLESEVIPTTSSPNSMDTYAVDEASIRTRPKRTICPPKHLDDFQTVWFLSERNEISQFRICCGRWRRPSLANNTAWSATSNTLLKSISRQRTYRNSFSSICATWCMKYTFA